MGPQTIECVNLDYCPVKLCIVDNAYEMNKYLHYFLISTRKQLNMLRQLLRQRATVFKLQMILPLHLYIPLQQSWVRCSGNRISRLSERFLVLVQSQDEYL